MIQSSAPGDRAEIKGKAYLGWLMLPVQHAPRPPWPPTAARPAAPPSAPCFLSSSFVVFPSFSLLSKRQAPFTFLSAAVAYRRGGQRDTPPPPPPWTPATSPARRCVPRRPPPAACCAAGAHWGRPRPYEVVTLKEEEEEGGCFLARCGCCSCSTGIAVCLSAGWQTP